MISSPKRAHVFWWKDLERWIVPAQQHSAKLPDGWSLVRIGDLVKQVSDKVKVEPNNEYKLAGVRWYGEGVFHRETVNGIDSSATYLMPLIPGAFIYNRLFAWKESFAVVPEALYGCLVSNEFPQFLVNSELLLVRYLYLFFMCKSTINAVNKASIGSAAVSRNRFKEEIFLNVQIPLPPLETQTAIVSRWQQAQTDIVAEENYAKEAERIAEIEFVKSLGLATPANLTRHKVFSLRWEQLDRWGVDVNQPANRLDINTSCFPVKMLSELIADLENGWSPQCLTRPAEDDEWGVLKVGAVSFGTFDQRQNKALPEKLHPIPRYEVKPGDLIISRANIARYVGACALVKEARPKLMLCDKLFRVVWKTQSAIIPEYLDEVMKTPHLRYQIENALTGTSPTMKNISKPSLLALRIPLPPLAIQKSLIESTMAKRVQAAEAREKAAQISSCIRSDIEAMILGTKQPPSVG
jgi:type I restriction enzyme, S subunit